MVSKDNRADAPAPLCPFLCPSDWLAVASTSGRLLPSGRRKEVTLEWPHLCVPSMEVCRLNHLSSVSVPPWLFHPPDNKATEARPAPLAPLSGRRRFFPGSELLASCSEGWRPGRGGLKRQKGYNCTADFTPGARITLPGASAALQGSRPLETVRPQASEAFLRPAPIHMFSPPLSSSCHLAVCQPGLGLGHRTPSLLFPWREQLGEGHWA